MTTMFLGFFINRSTREDFVAPAIAADASVAREELLKAYPESRYALLTIYSRHEMDNILLGIDRWPGLPSKVQPPLTTDLSKVTASTGGLPPLPGQVSGATVQQVQGNNQAMPAWMQSFIASNSPVSQPVPAPKAVTMPISKQPAQQPMMQAMAQPKTSLPPQSLIERLKAARGETVASTPIRREPTPDLSQAITRNAGGASVIDILKTMRK